MRKLILAIIGVICLDIGFVAYKSADDRGEVASRNVNVSDRGRDSIANPPIDLRESPQIPADLNATEPGSASTDARDDSIHPVRTTATRTGKIERSTYTANPRLRGVKRERPLAAKVYLSNITIFYPAPKPIEFKQEEKPVADAPIDRRAELANLPMSTSLRSGNRSLIARAWPIIKKPYDWIKAVGSRLN